MSDEIVQVKMTSQYGSLFPGEIAGFPPEKADEIVKKNAGFRCDKDGNPVNKQQVPGLNKQATPAANTQAAVDNKKDGDSKGDADGDSKNKK